MWQEVMKSKCGYCGFCGYQGLKTAITAETVETARYIQRIYLLIFKEKEF